MTGIPNGISGVGYGEGDIGALAEGAFAQQRLLTNAPRDIGRDDLGRLFRGAMRYWLRSLLQRTQRTGESFLLPRRPQWRLQNLMPGQC
jgi:hypothetical protein